MNSPLDGSDWLKLALLGTAAALGTASVGFSKTPYDDIFERVGKDKNIDPNLLRAIARAESNFNATAVRIEPSGKKSIGLMQILDVTAKALGVDPSRLTDPITNVATAARLLNAMKKELGSKFSMDTWISSYNAGTPNVLRYGIRNYEYVAKVELFYRLYSIGTRIG